MAATRVARLWNDNLGKYWIRQASDGAEFISYRQYPKLPIGTDATLKEAQDRCCADNQQIHALN